MVACPYPQRVAELGEQSSDREGVVQSDLARKLGLGQEARTILPVSNFDIERWEFHDWGPRFMQRSRNATAAFFLLIGFVGLMYEQSWGFFFGCVAFAIFSWTIFEIMRRSDVRQMREDKQRYLRELGYDDISVDDVTTRGDEKKPYVLVPSPHRYPHI